MAQDEEFPTLIWFSQADALGHLAQLDPDADMGLHVAALRASEDRLRQAGFATLTYIAFETIGRRILRAYLMREMSNVLFTTSYLKDRYFEYDPRLGALRKTGLPIIWEVEQLEKDVDVNDLRVRRLAQALRAQAMNCGLLLNLSAPQADLRIAISMTSEAHDTRWIDDRVLGCALAVSLHVHRLVQPYVEARARHAREVALSACQIAVLERLVKGLSDNEIAEALATPLHRISYHVKALQRRFNVENRAQLAYVAGRWRWQQEGEGIGLQAGRQTT